jgi:hypothetical protein
LIIGYPGETADDVRATANYLKQHDCCIERARLNRFQIVMGTRFDEDLRGPKLAFDDVTDVRMNQREALIDHHYRMTEDRQYRRAISELLGIVHCINRKPLRAAARAFDGVM